MVVADRVRWPGLGSGPEHAVSLRVIGRWSTLSIVPVLGTLLKLPLRLFKTSGPDQCLLASWKRFFQRHVSSSPQEDAQEPKWHPFIEGEEIASGRLATSTQERMTKEERRAPRTNAQTHRRCEVIKAMRQARCALDLSTT